mmetsp:Transcript_2651/g.3979  ORF Transcript_2651/g.3979 Transcript_2651/m.3979 type:complete len:371 (-) Transcript_2651:295-1407(-)
MSGDNNQTVVISICLCFATLSLFASVITLILIKRLKKWNGYLQLVVSLTICQIAYDIGFYPLPWFYTRVGELLFILLNTSGGLASSLWSNAIILVTCHIVMHLRSVDIIKMYPLYFTLVMVPSLSVAIVSAVFPDSSYTQMAYLAIRSLSILVNIVAILIIFCKISRMQKEGDVREDPNCNPVFVLSKRLVYYCMVQTVTRIGSSWYQLQYGFGGTYDADSASTLETAVYFSEFILNPSAGIGYLIVFLYIQPDAVGELRSLLRPRKFSRKKRLCGPRESLLDGIADDFTDPMLSEESANNNSLRRRSSSSQDSSFFPMLGWSPGTAPTVFPLLGMDEDGLAQEIDRRYSQAVFTPTRKHMGTASQAPSS